jgi:hypothetical protein
MSLLAGNKSKRPETIIGNIVFLSFVLAYNILLSSFDVIIRPVVTYLIRGMRINIALIE